MSHSLLLIFLALKIQFLLLSASKRQEEDNFHNFSPGVNLLQD